MPSTPKSRIRSSVWISMPNTPPEPQSPPPIFSSKLTRRSKLRSKKKSKKTLEWACEKDAKQTQKQKQKQLSYGEDGGVVYDQPQAFCGKLSFPGREDVQGLGFFVDSVPTRGPDTSPAYEPTSSSYPQCAEEETSMDIDYSESCRSRRSSCWSTASATTEESDEMELMTPTGSVGSLCDSMRMLPDIVITGPDGTEDFYDFEKEPRVGGGERKYAGHGLLGGLEGVEISKEDEDAAAILMQLRHQFTARE